MVSRIDHRLAFTIFILIILGSVFVFSSSYYQAMRQGEDSTYYLIGHLKRIIVGVIFLLLGFFIPYDLLRKILLPLFVMLLILLILTKVFGKLYYGAKRSLFISSFGVQISEFVRIWIILFLANFFTKHPETANSIKGLLSAVVFPLALIVLVAVQPSISVAIISFSALFCMLIYGNIKIKFLSPILLTGLALFFIAFLFLPHVRSRLFSFIAEPGYQVQQSLIAIGSGGLLAVLQKFLFLPRIHNDFIFAHIAEEVGFIGSVIIFLFYWEIFIRGITIANGIDEEFPKLIVLGLNATIFIIFLIHVGVSLGLLPPTGIPLPFVSYGGWSLCANLFSVGMILQISRLS